MKKPKTKSIPIGIILIGAILTMGIFGFGALASYREIKEEKSFVMDGINEIHVDMTSIPVHIIRTEAGGTIKFHLHGKAKRGIILVTEMINNTVVVQAKRKLDGPAIEDVLLDVYIPENYGKNLLTKTTSGIVNVDSINLTAFVFNTSSGGLAAEKLTAEKITIDSTSGNLNIKDLDSRELKIRGSSSDVMITCKQFSNQNIDIKTTSGNVTLELPGTAEFIYKIVTASGQFNSDFPINKSENTSKINLEGQLGNRSNKVSLQASSGNITILKK